MPRINRVSATIKVTYDPSYHKPWVFSTPFEDLGGWMWRELLLEEFERIVGYLEHAATDRRALNVDFVDGLASITRVDDDDEEEEEEGES